MPQGYGNLNGDGFGIGWFPPDGTAPSADQTPCVSLRGTLRRPSVVACCVSCCGAWLCMCSVAAAHPGPMLLAHPHTQVALPHMFPTPKPQVFTSITPAWNNENLNRLATKLESGVIFAHVRAAYPGMPVSEQNCHPFQWGERQLGEERRGRGVHCLRQRCHLLVGTGGAAARLVKSGELAATVAGAGAESPYACMSTARRPLSVYAQRRGGRLHAGGLHLVTVAAVADDTPHVPKGVHRILQHGTLCTHTCMPLCPAAARRSGASCWRS